MSQFDWLSPLLEMIAVTGTLDIRCSYAAPWRVARSSSDMRDIPYFVMLKGRAIVEMPEMKEAWELVGGDILMLPHGAAHVLHDGSGEPSSHISDRPGPAGWLVSESDGKGEHVDMLSGHFFVEAPHDRLIREYLPPIIVAQAAKHSNEESVKSASHRLANLIELMRMECNGDKSGGYAIFSALSPVLFTLALSTASESEPTPSGWLALAACPRLAPAIYAMFSDPAHPWDLSDLAELCGMSRATFMRHFQERLGRSAFKLLTDIRLGLAANELRIAPTSTETVAKSVGYRSVAAFRRVFTDKMGMSPGQWRRSMRDVRERREGRVTFTQRNYVDLPI